MKILQITDGIPPVVLGGSGRICWEMSAGLARRGLTVSLLTAAPEGALPQEQDNVRIFRLPPRHLRWAHFRSVFSQGQAEKVLRMIDAVQPDLIHGHTVAWQMGYRWIPLARARGIPVILTAHDAMMVAYGKVTGKEPHLWLKELSEQRWQWNPLRGPFLRRLLRQCNAILCVSDALKRYLALHGIPHLQRLHNGIDTDFWRPSVAQEEARAALRLPLGAPLFLLAGRVGIDKGARVAVDALPKDAHLLVAGKTDLRLFSTLGQRVHSFPDQSSEAMRMLYAACDAAVAPSIYLDPFPTVCLEAMACGRPVVATSRGGAKEAVIDGRTGWVRDPESLEFREQLQWCSEHRAELLLYGEHARKHVEEHFSRERFLDELVKIYHHYDAHRPPHH